MDCPRCNNANPDAARFCANCGAPLGRQCPGCGAAFADGQKFCSACGRALGAAGAAKSGVDEGERRQATVVFSDLTGYTALNERLDPEEVEQVMARIKREATAIVESHGGTINQFIGDEIVALFGVPVARRDDPQRAVRAAMELHRVVRAIGDEVAPRIGRALSMHTGANSGLIVIRRSDSRDGRYALTGDMVNTGARLLGLAAADEIVVGQDTWRQISGEFVGEMRAPVEVKGKEFPLAPYCVRSERAPAERSIRPLAGRAEEVRQFSALAQACLERRRGRLIILRGDPGIGKSRLAREFLAIAESHGYRCHSALVLDFSAARGHDTIRSLARSLLAVPEDADDGAKLGAIARALAGGLAAPDQELFLCDLLDVSPRTELRTIQAAITEQARNQGTVDALCDLARHASARHPLMLLVEDIHWADAWTLERLAALATLASDHPLLVEFTTRFDGDPSAGAWHSALHRAPVTGIDLGPLPAEDALHLAEQFGTLPAALARSYIERAEGNPLFLEQLLLNAEAIEQTGLPGSIQALVLARMDRLAPADRQAFQAASVLGQRFSLDTLRHLVQDPGYECTTLTGHFLVRPEGMDYLFCHALIRDGAYESLLRSRRRELHARAAQWFESRDLPLAAEHFDRGAHPQAATAFLAASEAEAARYHYGGALALCERGLALAADREEKFALASVRARVLNDVGRAQESIEAWRAALDASEGGTERCRALIGYAQGMRIVEQTQAGLAALAEAEPLAREANLPLELSRVHHLRGNFYFGLGRGTDCLREHEQAFALAQEAGSLEAEANALSGLGDGHYMAGRMRSANERFRRCVELAHGHGFGRIEVANMLMMGWTAHYLNELRNSLNTGIECVEMAATVSHLRVELLARQIAAYVGGWLIGDTGSGRGHLDAALKICQTLGAKRFESQNIGYQALLSLRDGARVPAERLAREALRFSREHGMDFFGPVLLGLVGRLTADAGERTALNTEAEARLARGCISHNHFEFYALAIESALERGAWNEVERYCDALDRYTANEPLPWSDLLTARGRQLARFGRGARDAGLLGDLLRLREQAARCEFNVALPALDAALDQAANPAR